MNAALAILLFSLAVTSTLAKPRPRPNCVLFCNDSPLSGGGAGFGQVQQPMIQKPTFQMPNFVQQPAHYQQQPSYTGSYGQPSYGGNYVQQPAYTGGYGGRPSGYRSANVETLEPVATVGGGVDQAVMFHHSESSSHNSQTGYVSYPVRRPTEQIRVQRPCVNEYVDPCTV